MNPSYSKHFLKDNSIVISGNILGVFKNIIIIPIIIGTVGIGTYGSFILITSLIGFLYGISSFGIGFKMQRFMPGSDNILKSQKLFYDQLFFQLLSIIAISILLVIFNNTLDKYLLKGEYDYNYLLLPILLIAQFIYSQGTVYFRYSSRIKAMTIASVIAPYLHITFILLISFYLGQMSINILLFSQAVAYILIAIVCFWIITSEIGVYISFQKIKSLIEDIKLGFPLVFNYAFDFVLAGSDRFIIAYFLTVTDVGHYTLGYMLGALTIFLPKAMGGVMPQLLSKAVDGNNEGNAHTMFHYSLKIFLLLVIPYSFGILIFGDQILTLLANAEIAEYSFFIAFIVSIGTLFQGLNILLSNALFVKMQTGAILKMNLYASLFNLFANIILLYFFRDILWAAITTLLSYFIAFIYVKIMVKKEWEVNFNYILIFKSILASITMFITLEVVQSYFLELNSVIYLIPGVAFGILIYVSMLFLLKSFSVKEITFIKNLLFSR